MTLCGALSILPSYGRHCFNYQTMVTTINGYQSNKIPFGNAKVHTEREEGKKKAKKLQEESKTKHLHNSSKQKCQEASSISQSFFPCLTTLLKVDVL